MVMTIAEIRQNHPEYGDMTDQAIADGIHKKYYSDMEKDKVYESLGLGEKVTPDEQASIEAPKEVTGFRGLASDAISGLSNALKNLQSFGIEIPENLRKNAQDFKNNPLQAGLHRAGQMGAGAAESGKALLNMPHEILGELGRKELIPEWLKKYNELPFTHIPEDTGVEKLLGTEVDPEKGDRLTRALPDMALLGAGGVGLIKGGKKALTAPSKESLFQKSLQKGIDKAKIEKNLSEADLKALKDSLTEQFSGDFGSRIGKTDVVGQKESINVKKAALKDKEPDTLIPKEEIKELPPEPDTKKMIADHKASVEAAKTEAEKAIGILDNPKLKAGSKVQSSIKDLHKSSSDLYKAARKHYVDKKIVADNSKELKGVTSDLEALKDADELAPGYGSGTSDQKALQNTIESLKNEKVSASDMFDLQRTLEKMADNTRKKQYSGVPELEFKKLGSLAERLDSHADKIAGRLEAVGGKEVQGIIKEANKGWKTYKDLSKKNPVGKASLKGDVPNNAMIELAKDHPGNEFLNGLVNSDPELKKNLLAAYAGEANINKLIKPTTLTKKYLQSLPEVEEHVNALKNAISDYKAGKSEASKIKSEYKSLADSMKEAATRQQTREKAIIETDKLKKEIKFHQDAIPQLERKIKIAEEKGAKHEKLVKELSDHKQSIKDKNYKLKKYGNTILKLTGASSLLHKAGF